MNRCAELLCLAFVERRVLARRLACALDASELALSRQIRSALLGELARLVSALDIELEAEARDAFAIWDGASTSHLFEAVETLRRIEDANDLESRLPIWRDAKRRFSATS